MSQADADLVYINAIKIANPGVTDDEAQQALYQFRAGQTSSPVPEAQPQPRNAVGQAIESGLGSMREGVGRVPYLGGLLQALMPSSPGGLAADVTAAGLPLLGALAATNPVTAPLAPFLATAGPASRGARIASAVGRAGLVGGAAAGAEALTGGQNPVGEGLRAGGAALVSEPVAALIGKLAIGTLGRSGVAANDARLLGQVIESEVVNPVTGRPIFGELRTPQQLVEVGQTGLAKLRSAFNDSEQSIVSRAGADPLIEAPTIVRAAQALGKGTQRVGGIDTPIGAGTVNLNPATNRPAVTLQDALDTIKTLGDARFGGKTAEDLTARGFDARQAYRQAQDEIETWLVSRDPRLALDYRGIRTAYDKGLEVIGLLGSTGVKEGAPNAAKLNMEAFQQAVFGRLGELQRAGLATQTPQGAAGPLLNATYRGGPVGSQDASYTVPLLARLFGAPGAAAYARVPFLSGTYYTGLPQPGPIVGAIPGAVRVGTVAGAGALPGGVPPSRP